MSEEQGTPEFPRLAADLAQSAAMTMTRSPAAGCDRLPVVDAAGLDIDELPLDDEEPFLLETFRSLIEAHARVGKRLILARVVVTASAADEARASAEDGGGGGGRAPPEDNAGNAPPPAKPHYYAAHQINKVIFRKAGKSWIFRLYARDPLTNLEILGDVSYFMVMPTRYRKEGTVQADGRRGPPVSERADSRLPAGQKRSAGLPAPAAANVRGSSSGTNLNQVDLAARRQSFERMMKAALERDNGSMTVAEVSGPYFPEIVHDQAAGITPSPCPAAAAGASHQYAHDRLSESLNIPRCKGASQQTAVRRTPSVETADGEPSLADAKRRSITSSEPSLKVKLHRKSWARSPEETGGLLAYQIPDYPPEVRPPFDGGAAGGAGRGSVSDEGRRGEKGEDEEQVGLVSSTSAATIDSERFGGDVRSPAGLSAAEAAADWPGYQAVFIGTDDHFLTMASLRKIFEVNAVDAADSRLFEIPPAVLRQEGILLTEEDEEEEDGPPDGRAVSGDAERTFAPGTGGGPPPAPQPAHAAGPPRGQQLPRGPGTVLVPGHGVMSLSNVAGDPSTDAVDGGHAAAGPLDADDRTKETDRLGTWAGRSPRYLQRSLRRHQYPLILLLGLLVGVAFHFTLPPDDAWKAVTGALGASAVVVVARMYARRKRQRELIRQDAAARRY